MSIYNDFKIQGDYKIGNELSNIKLNENVKTSSIITWNLLELIKNKYIDGNINIEVNGNESIMNEAFKRAFNNYIGDLLIDKGLCKYNDENNYQYLTYNTTNNGLIIGNNYISTSFYKEGKNKHVGSVERLLAIDNDVIYSTIDNINFILSHKQFFASNTPIGLPRNLDSSGYDSYIYLSQIKCDKYGHLSGANNFKYTAPTKESCCKVLFNGKTELSYASLSKIHLQKRTSNYDLDNFTTLIITLVDAYNYMYSYIIDVKSLYAMDNEETIFLPFMNTGRGMEIMYFSNVGYSFYTENDKQVIPDIKVYLTGIVAFVYGNDIEQG